MFSYMRTERGIAENIKPDLRKRQFIFSWSLMTPTVSLAAVVLCRCGSKDHYNTSSYIYPQFRWKEGAFLMTWVRSILNVSKAKSTNSSRSDLLSVFPMSINITTTDTRSPSPAISFHHQIVLVFTFHLYLHFPNLSLIIYHTFTIFHVLL